MSENILPERIVRLLKEAGHEDLAQLIFIEDKELLRIAGIGPSALKQIRRATGASFFHRPVNAQAELLGVGYESHRCQIGPDGPERTALALYQEHGWMGAACEGGTVQTLLKALCLDLLATYPPFDDDRFAGLPTDTTRLARHYFPAICVVYRRRAMQMLVAVRNGSADQIRRNFHLIYESWLEQGKYPGLTAELMTALWQALGQDLLERILARLLEASYDYGKGWPDLTLVRDRDFLFVEVKTTDRLYPSQLLWFRGMAEPLRLPVHILQLVPQ